MHLSDVLQWVDLVDFSLELARLQQIEQLIRVEFKLFSGFNVSEKGWTRNLDTLG